MEEQGYNFLFLLDKYIFLGEQKRLPILVAFFRFIPLTLVNNC